MIFDALKTLQFSQPRNQIDELARRGKVKANFAAACAHCGGWKPCGGMSRFRDTAQGCFCHNTAASGAFQELPKSES